MSEYNEYALDAFEAANLIMQDRILDEETILRVLHSSLQYEDVAKLLSLWLHESDEDERDLILEDAVALTNEDLGE